MPFLLSLLKVGIVTHLGHFYPGRVFYFAVQYSPRNEPVQAVVLTLSVMRYLTGYFHGGGLKDPQLKPDLTLSNYYANHTM